MQNFRPLFPAASSAIVMWTRQELKIVVYSYEKSSDGKQIMAAEKMRQKSHRVYLSEIIQSSSLGRWQKKSLEHNDVCIGTESQESPSGKCLQSAKLLSNKFSKCYFFIGTCPKFTEQLLRSGILTKWCSLSL